MLPPILLRWPGYVDSLKDEKLKNILPALFLQRLTLSELLCIFCDKLLRHMAGVATHSQAPLS